MRPATNASSDLRTDPCASIEILNAGLDARDARAAVFDFDGTLSLIRSGWADVMVPLMTSALMDLNTGEPEESLKTIVRDFVDRLTGKQTIFQMFELARQVELRGGRPEDPLVYKRRYLDRLHGRIAHRLDGLRSGSERPDKYLVPGSAELLASLRERGLKLYLASGTDQELVREEARLLGIAAHFNGGVFGALDDYRSFSKRMLIRRLLADPELSGTRILGFGDGYVEIENIKEANGVAIGVATDEPRCQSVDGWKRHRLVRAGADAIIPNYNCRQELFSLIFPQ
ncbi:MAG TPA: HAD family hydrolase [Bryobacteraceae bacterium]|nr:HAD family hydrolase [Bryobacteraceae bacterium]